MKKISKMNLGKAIDFEFEGEGSNATNENKASNLNDISNLESFISKDQNDDNVEPRKSATSFRVPSRAELEEA